MILPPLRWVAQEPLVYDEEARTIHRPFCHQARGDSLKAGDVIEAVWAPRICSECRPDVLMKLGR